MKHLDLFSGIGGFALAAERVWPNIEHIFCDNEPYAQEILKKHWPNSKIYGDIRTLTNAKSEQTDSTESTRPHAELGIRNCDLLTGGFPCQPFSQAGRRRGEEDDRFLWPEMLRVIREFSPLWVIAENVRGLLTQGGGVVFERVCTDLEAAGYEVQPIIIPAVAVGAPHRRDRVWFVANRISDSGERWGGNGNVAGKTSKSQRAGEKRQRDGDATDHRSTTRTEWKENWLEVATRLCGIFNGLSRELDRNPRLKALGNAIVPQVAEEIMKAIKYI